MNIVGGRGEGGERSRPARDRPKHYKLFRYSGGEMRTVGGKVRVTPADMKHHLVMPSQPETNDTEANMIDDTIFIYYTPVLVVFGGVGNVISLCVFCCSKLRNFSSSYYLTALATSDLTFLCVLFFVWINKIKVLSASDNVRLLEGCVYASYVCSELSSWFVVAFTGERFVAVVYPLRRRATCTTARARTIISVLVIAALVTNLPLLWFARTKRDDPVEDPMRVHAARFNAFDTVFSFTIPMISIVGLNAGIACSVYSWRGPRHHHSQPRRNLNVTKMLMFVSMVFVALNLPSYVMRIMAYTGISRSEHLDLMQSLCNIVAFNTNFGINFFLYCICGGNFRQALLSLLCFRIAGSSRTLGSVRPLASPRTSARLNPAAPLSTATLDIHKIDIEQHVL